MNARLPAGFFYAAWALARRSILANSSRMAFSIKSWTFPPRSHLYKVGGLIPARLQKCRLLVPSGRVLSLFIFLLFLDPDKAPHWAGQPLLRIRGMCRQKSFPRLPANCNPPKRWSNKCHRKLLMIVPCFLLLLPGRRRAGWLHRECQLIPVFRIEIRGVRCPAFSRNMDRGKSCFFSVLSCRVAAVQYFPVQCVCSPDIQVCYPCFS